ncbi:hypothetical protein Tco_0891704 [Tanacetum coccineum]|uniref:Uncharacterized protein n=1 Tax=Tanacetum coccineum TaxID=301880 RepID=A0ABQ5C6M1_9ASTR
MGGLLASKHRFELEGNHGIGIEPRGDMRRSTLGVGPLSGKGPRLSWLPGRGLPFTDVLKNDKNGHRHDQASKISKSSCDGCWIAKSWITCVNTNGNTTLSEAQGVSLRITSSMRVRTLYHDLYLDGKDLVEKENVGLRVADSHTGNHLEDDFMPLETIRRLYSVIRKRIPFELEGQTFEPKRGAKDSIATQTCELSKEEFNDFLTLYPIPSEYRVILPKSNQTVFGAPPGLYPFGCAKPTTFVVMCKAYGCEPPVYLFRGFFNLCQAGKWLNFSKRSEKHVPNLLPKVITRIEEMAFGNFIYTEDDEDLSFLPKDPSPGLSTGSPSVSVNTEPLKADKELVIAPAEVTTDSGESPKPELFVVHPGSVAARIKDRKCKTRGGSSRPPIKRKLAPGSSTSCATRAKTSSSKEDVPFLTVSDDDEGLPDVIEKLRGEFDVMRSRESAREEECEGLRVKCEASMTKFEKNPVVVAFREKIFALSTEVKEHKLNLDRMMLESQKWASYQQSLSTLESKVNSLDAKKARLEAAEVSLRKEVEELKHDRIEVVSKVVPYDAMELVHSDDMGSLVGKLVSSAIVYGRCRAFEQVADMKEPFDLSKFVADPSTPIEALLSKKPPTLQRPAPSRTQVPLPSSQRVTPSSVLVSNPMSPPADAFVVKPQSSQLH